MVDVFLVDDDLDFIENMRYIALEGVQLHVFSNVMDAIAEVGRIAPSIVVSDVQMSGVHGLDFRTIARELIKPQCFILISGNPSAEVEKKFGTFGDTPFFKKPLEDDFYAFLTDKAAACAALNARPGPNTDPSPSSSPIPSPSPSPAAPEGFVDKARGLEKVFSAWKKIQDHKYDGLVKAGFGLFRSDEYHAKSRELGRELEIVCATLELAPDGKSRFLSQYEERPESFACRVASHIRNDVKSETRILDAPMPFDFRFSGGELVWLRSFGIRVAGSDVRLELDGALQHGQPPFLAARSAHPRGVQEASKAVETLESLESLGCFLLLKSRCENELAGAASKLYFGAPDLHGRVESSAKEAVIRIPGLRLMGVAIEELRIDFKTRLAGRLQAVGEGKVFDLPPSELSKSLPDAFSLEAVRRVEAKRASPFELDCVLEGIPLVVPIERIVADEVARGFETSDNVYFRLAASVSFLWEVALGKRVWRFGRTTLTLDSCLRAPDRAG